MANLLIAQPKATSPSNIVDLLSRIGKDNPKSNRLEANLVVVNDDTGEVESLLILF